MANDGKIEGKNVLITGGASGLGAAYAEAFLKFGAKNIAILDVAEGGKDYADKLNGTYKDKVIFVKCDVSKEEDIENSFKEVLTEKTKRIDVIINNAGIMDDSTDAWRTASEVNWQGVVSLTKKGITHMRKDEGGSGGTIVNISSVAALRKVQYVPVYCGSKAAVLHFSRCISSPEFYDSTGVRILTICFGATATAIFSNLLNKFIDPKFCKEYVPPNAPFQRIETAVEAFLKMFREGRPGSVWLSQYDQPVEDITSVLDEAYEPLLKLLLPNGA